MDTVLDEPTGSSAWKRAWRCSGWAVLLAYAVCLLATLGDYGVTWDEPRWFQVGDRHVQFFSELDPAALAVPEGHEGWGAYGPLAAIVSSLAERLFGGVLGWVEGEAARHLGLLGFALVAAFALWDLVRTREGARTALAALLVYCLLPRAFGHAHNNISDMPAAACWLAVLACTARWCRSGKVAPLVGAGLLLGCAGAVRPQTAIFLPPLLALWILLDRELRDRVKRRPVVVALVGALAVLGLFVSWPMFWVEPLGSARFVIDFFLHPPEGQGVVPIFYLGERYDVSAPWHYSFVMLLATTPLPVLALALVGVASPWLARRSAASISLPLAWLAISVGKHTLLPGNYDGIRHFLDALGALAWLAGLGASTLVATLARRAPRLAPLGWFTLAAAFLPTVIQTARLHPYQQVYYNTAIGGLAGAEGRFESDYWGFTMKEGMSWANEHLEPGSILAVPWGKELTEYYARPGLEVVSANASQGIRRLEVLARRTPDTPIYFAFHMRRGWLSTRGSVNYVRAEHDRVHSIDREGVSLFEVYCLSD